MIRIFSKAFDMINSSYMLLVISVDLMNCGKKFRKLSASSLARSFFAAISRDHDFTDGFAAVEEVGLEGVLASRRKGKIAY